MACRVFRELAQNPSGGTIPIASSLLLADGSLPEADGSLPEADGSLPEADGSLPEADGSLPEADGSIPITTTILIFFESQSISGVFLRVYW